MLDYELTKQEHKTLLKMVEDCQFALENAHHSYKRMIEAQQEAYGKHLDDLELIFGELLDSLGDLYKGPLPVKTCGSDLKPNTFQFPTWKESK
jgi:hypothetical protein